MNSQSASEPSRTPARVAQTRLRSIFSPLARRRIARGGGLEKKRPGVSAGPSFVRRAWGSVAIAHEAQQEEEQVDEVEIEGQRPHDDRLAGIIGAGDGEIHALDLLR